MVVNDIHRFIFIHIPKCAGTSISAELSRMRGDNTRVTAATKHETLGEFLANWRSRKSIFFRKDPATYYRFSFVRNPWVRMFSFYNYLLKRGRRRDIDAFGSFEDFLEKTENSDALVKQHRSLKPMCEFLRDEQDEFAMDYLGHLEHLTEDLAVISSELGIKVSLPHLNKSAASSLDYRDAYNDKSIEIVARRFSEDIEQFGYVFGQPQPTARISGKMDGKRVPGKAPGPLPESG